jgi:hypothetical protein
MKNHFLTLAFLLLSFIGFSQENSNYKEYSYTEFFRMIEQEEDTIFKLSNTIIRPNIITDKAYLQKSSGKSNSSENIVINKELQLHNVQFMGVGQSFNQMGLLNITFNKKVSVSNCHSLNISRCLFKEAFNVNNRNSLLREQEDFAQKVPVFYVNDTKFYDDVNIGVMNIFDSKNYFFSLRNSAFLGTNKNGSVNIGAFKMTSAVFTENDFSSLGINSIYFEENEQAGIIRNSFTKGIVKLYTTEDEEFVMYENRFESEALLNINIYNNLAMIGIDQFNGPVSSLLGLEKFMTDKKIIYRNPNYDSIVKAYKTEYRIQNKISFNYEIEQLSEFYNYYKNKFNTDEANKYYIDIKNLETQRLAYLYSNNPTFKTYFTWKTNQFLKVFSAYGTEPARAIIYSVYVIILFAIIYLFFPNYWDSHGKNRIRDRFLFFQKYLRHPKGIHDVYLDEHKTELEEAYQFQHVLEKYKTEVPNIFYQAAKPLHKWSVAGTLLHSRLLSKIDFLKGSWKDTNPKVRVLKTSLTLVIFFIALLYDIFIKMLNALMLSINTFTTLGFGEIPIKGLPRYLAIIQGFIGWFMLTIFSVSLISQLLN